MSPLDEIDDLATLVRRAAGQWPDKPAWIFDETGEHVTFAEVERRSTRFALAFLELGLRPGERVAVMLRNQPEFPLLWLALAKLGAVLVPVNTNYREFDGAHVLRHSGARFAVAAPEFVDLLSRIAPDTKVERVLTVGDLRAESIAAARFEVVGEQPVNIQYTSGTTGAPKGCVLPHRYWLTLARGLVADFPAVSPDDTILTAQPFHYIDPQWNVALGLAAGATLVVLDRFHPSTFWAKVREHGVTWFYCLGLMPTLLLRQPESPADREHRVRAISASAIPRDLHAQLEERWGVPWYEAFGMTETGGDIRVSEADHDELVGTGCIGRPTRDREAMVVDDEGRPVPRGETGELVLRGIGLMHGYHDDPEATAKAFRGGWFHTGDLATMDSRGRVFYVGRTKDMIRRSGENISADEVERALLLHPAVELAAVVAVPDELRGEEVKVFIVLRGEATPDELAEFCTTKLAYFKVPRYWAVADTLPRTPSERVAKGELRDSPLPTYDRVRQAWL
ncbi:crotonobetaine/carnitine-CoA ligase [Amycolatopsis bartoniae]|uniref:Acyl-CoA synthetase n=1 Tax=Amycolatopsis bartoniae TaxID=941986 RepID=A0A8H9MBA5_9PSEU|nr:ATP-dependent acyl-CoA ligase [Amycolatopsis bartoniae]MBB2934877.1 crotonobetaine/carnitine-CoA ligase [Amycolatopsis bartoniae]TVT00763.1 ATP-dependent acyl-CoA ligase [Amycolatopsis bartoniae]GHF44134.1 acyl-CoA synthetase [Amycolatopsis bartoniae]